MLLTLIAICAPAAAQAPVSPSVARSASAASLVAAGGKRQAAELCPTARAGAGTEPGVRRLGLPHARHWHVRARWRGRAERQRAALVIRRAGSLSTGADAPPMPPIMLTNRGENRTCRAPPRRVASPDRLDRDRLARPRRCCYGARLIGGSGLLLVRKRRRRFGWRARRGGRVVKGGRL